MDRLWDHEPMVSTFACPEDLNTLLFPRVPVTEAPGSRDSTPPSMDPDGP
jgi:hypothetical protein